MHHGWGGQLGAQSRTVAVGEEETELPSRSLPATVNVSEQELIVGDREAQRLLRCRGQRNLAEID